MTILLILAVLFLLSWWSAAPQPVLIICWVAIALAIVLWFTPFGPIRSFGW